MPVNIRYVPGNRGRGFSLIEVLVAVLVLAIGLLGLAGLQLTGLKSNHSAYVRSQAALLAYDITERMRANRAAALVGDYDNCAAYDDCADWEASVSALMGEGATGTIIRNGNTVEIQIAWDDSRGSIRDGDGESSSETVTFVFTTEI